MKKLLLTPWLLLPLLAMGQDNLITANVANYGITPQANIRVTLTLLWPNPRTYDNLLIRQDPVAALTKTNGIAYFTNILWGQYRVDVAGNPGTKFTAYVGTNTIGTVTIASLITNAAALPPNNATNYYTQAQIDALLAGITNGGGGSATNVNFLAGQNTTWRTSGGSNVVDVVGTLTNNTTGNAATATTATTATSATSATTATTASYVTGTLTNNTTGNSATASAATNAPDSNTIASLNQITNRIAAGFTNGSSVFGAHNIVVGSNTISTSDINSLSNSVLIGNKMTGNLVGDQTIFIGGLPNSGGVGGLGTIAIGSGSGARETSISIGYQSDVFSKNSIGLGNNLTADDNTNSIIIGNSSTLTAKNGAIQIGNSLIGVALDYQTVIGNTTTTNTWLRGLITGNGGGLTNLVFSWTNLLNIPAGFADGVDDTGGAGGAATNAVTTVGTNNVNLSTAATNMQFFSGSGITVTGTNSTGKIGLVIAQDGTLGTLTQINTASNQAIVTATNNAKSYADATFATSAQFTAGTNTTQLNATNSAKSYADATFQPKDTDLSGWALIATNAIDAANIATGLLSDSRLNSTVTLDTEWNTIAKIVTATGSDIVTNNRASSMTNLTSIGSPLLYGKLQTNSLSGTGVFLAWSNGVPVLTNVPAGGSGDIVSTAQNNFSGSNYFGTNVTIAGTLSANTFSVSNLYADTLQNTNITYGYAYWSNSFLVMSNLPAAGSGTVSNAANLTPGWFVMAQTANGVSNTLNGSSLTNLQATGISTNGASAVGQVPAVQPNGTVAWTNQTASGTGSTNMYDVGTNSVFKGNIVLTNSGLSQLIIGATNQIGASTNAVEIIYGGVLYSRIGTNGVFYGNGSGLTNVTASATNTTDPRFTSSSGTITAASNTFAATTFSGALSGNATSATGATHATNFWGTLNNTNLPVTVTTNNGVLASTALLVGDTGRGVAGTTTGAGVISTLGIATNTAGGIVTQNGPLGTPSTGSAANLTGYPINSLATNSLIGTGPFLVVSNNVVVRSNVPAGGAGDAVLSASQTFTGVNTFSNNILMDAAHSLYLSNLTTARVLIYDTARGVTNVGFQVQPTNGNLGALSDAAWTVTSTSITTPAGGTTTTLGTKVGDPLLLQGDIYGKGNGITNVPIGNTITNGLIGSGPFLAVSNNMIVMTNAPGGSGGGGFTGNANQFSVSNGSTNIISGVTLTNAQLYSGGTLYGSWTNQGGVGNYQRGGEWYTNDVTSTWQSESNGIVTIGSNTLTSVTLNGVVGSLTLTNVTAANNTAQLMLGTNSIEAQSQIEVWNPQGTRIFDLETNGAIVVSNLTATVITNTSLTGTRVQMTDANKKETSVAVTGVLLGTGSGAAWSDIQSLAPTVVQTNGASTAYSNNVDVVSQQFDSLTNLAATASAPVVDFTKSYALMSTNADFSFATTVAGLNANLVQTAVIIVTNAAKGSLMTVTVPAVYKLQGSAYVTNNGQTVFTFMQYGGRFTNVTALPLF